MSLESKSPSPAQAALTHLARIVLESAVERLPEAYRTVFMLREVEGMTAAETAECLGLSEEAVRVRLRRARGLMRQQIYAQTEAAMAGAFQFMGARCDRTVAAVLGRIRSLRGDASD